MTSELLATWVLIYLQHVTFLKSSSVGKTCVIDGTKGQPVHLACRHCLSQLGLLVARIRARDTMRLIFNPCHELCPQIIYMRDGNGRATRR